MAVGLPRLDEGIGLAVLTSSDRLLAWLTAILWVDTHLGVNQVELEPCREDKAAVTPSWAKRESTFFASAGLNWAAETKHPGESDIMALWAHPEENRVRKIKLPCGCGVELMWRRKYKKESLLNKQLLFQSIERFYLNFPTATENIQTHAYAFLNKKYFGRTSMGCLLGSNIVSALSLRVYLWPRVTTE